MTAQREVATPQGMARLVIDRARRPVASLLLSHGAGGGIDAPDLLALARSLPAHGISVTRLEQPWRVAGKRVAPRPAALDESLVAILASQRRSRGARPLVLGGRSAGARSAARCARAAGAAGCLALAFPLHPPGRPDKSRLGELTEAGVPTLVVQGERDAFGRPEEFPERQELAVVPGADHSFQVAVRTGLSADDALGILVEAVLEWLVRDIVGIESRASAFLPL